MTIKLEYNMENNYNLRIVEQEKLVMDYIKIMFQFRKSFNHKLSSIDIMHLINQIINYKFYKSEIYSNIDEKLVHDCMINVGFRYKQEKNYYIYNVGIKQHIQKLLKIHAEY